MSANPNVRASSKSIRLQVLCAMFLIYNILQTLFILAFLPIIAIKLAFTTKYRKNLIYRLGFGIPTHCMSGIGPRIWIHALSVGEVNSSVALVREIRRRFSDSTIIFSTSTITGKLTAKQKLGEIVDLFISCPFDILGSVKRVVKRIRPDLFILIETDLWPNLLHELSTNGGLIMLLNGRLSDSSYNFYKRFRFFFYRVFSFIDFFAMQSGTDEDKLIRLGIDSRRIFKLGNLKYDQEVTTQEQTVRELKQILHSVPDRRIFVAGSTHEGEEELILSAYKRVISHYPELVLIIAPRDPKRSDTVMELAKKAGFQAQKRSRLSPLEPRKLQIMVLDTLGELSALYGLATVGFVGGSLVPERGHNVLEVAAHAKPVLFGPHIEDFEDAARSLLARGGGFMVRDDKELAERLEYLLSDENISREQGGKAYRFVEENKGAVSRTIDLISQVMNRRRAL